MLRAIGLGTLAQSSLLLSGLIVYWVTVPHRLVGILAGFGAGALVSSLSFELVGEVHTLTGAAIALWLLVGAGIFVVADTTVEHRFGADGSSSALGIVVGSMVDGVPESVIFGMQVASGFPVSASFFAAVLISNVPQALAPSADLAEKGWPIRRMARMWIAVVLSCGIAAALGYALANIGPDSTPDVMACIASGGLLAMLTDSLMPFAFERGGDLAGVATVVGFAFALLIS